MARWQGSTPVFGLDQILALGLTARAVQKRAAAGRLHRIHQASTPWCPRVC